MNEETKQKISNSLKGHRPWSKGKHHSEETKQKMRQSHLGKPGTRLGFKTSEKTKRKMSLANKGNKKCANSGSFQKGHIYHSHQLKEEN